MKKIILLVFLLVLVSVVFGQQQRFYGVDEGGDPCKQFRDRIVNYETQLRDQSLTHEERENLDLGLMDTKERLRRCEQSQQERPEEPPARPPVRVQNQIIPSAPKGITTQEWHDWIIPIYKNIDNIVCSDLQDKLNELSGLFISQPEGTIKNQMNKELANFERKLSELFPNGCEAQAEQPPTEQPPVSIDPFLNEGGFLACSCEGPTQEEYRTGSGNVQKIKRGNAIRVRCDFYEMSTFESGDKTIVQFFGPNHLASDESYSFSFNENELSSEGHICGCNDLSNALNGLNNPKFQLMSSFPDGNYIPISRNDVEAHEEGVNNDKRGKKMGDARNKQRIDLEQKIGSALAVISPTPCEGRETGFRTPTPPDALSKPPVQVAVGLPDDLMPDPEAMAVCMDTNKESEEIKKKIAALEKEAAKIGSLLTPSSITTAVTVTGLQTLTGAVTLEELSEQIAALNEQLNALQQNVCDPNFYRDLRVGLSGTDVTRLQNYLNQAGYFNYPSTSYFGLKTEAAVRKFQQDNNILQTPTGIFGPKTRAKLLASLPPADINLGVTLANTLTTHSGDPLDVSLSADVLSGKPYCNEYVDGRVEAGFNTDQGFIVKTFPTCAGRVALKATCIQNIIALEGQQVAEITQEICGENQYCLEGACSDKSSEPSTGGISITCPNGQCETGPETGTSSGPEYIQVTISGRTQTYPRCSKQNGVTEIAISQEEYYYYPDIWPSYCYSCPSSVQKEPNVQICGTQPETGTQTPTQPADWTPVTGVCSVAQINKGCRSLGFICKCPPETGSSQPVDTTPGAVCPSDCRDMGESDGKKLCNCCGNGKIDNNAASSNYLTVYETCDGSNFGGATCATEKGSGYEGSLSCITCQTIDSSACGKRPETGTSQPQQADNYCANPQNSDLDDPDCETCWSNIFNTRQDILSSPDCLNHREQRIFDTNPSRCKTEYVCDDDDMPICTLPDGMKWKMEVDQYNRCIANEGYSCWENSIPQNQPSECISAFPLCSNVQISQQPSCCVGKNEGACCYTNPSNPNDPKYQPQNGICPPSGGWSDNLYGKADVPLDASTGEDWCAGGTIACGSYGCSCYMNGVLVADASTDNTGGTTGPTGTGAGSGIAGPAVVFSQNYCYWGVFWNPRTQRMECI